MAFVQIQNIYLCSCVADLCDPFLASINLLKTDYSTQDGTQIVQFLTLLHELIDIAKIKAQNLHKCSHKPLPLKPYLRLSEGSRRNSDGRIVEMKQKNKDLEKIIVKLQRKNEELDKELEQKIKEANRDPKSVKKLEETVEDLRNKLAPKYQEMGRFGSAAQQYRALKDLKNKQRNRLPDNTPGASQFVHVAKEAELRYSHKYGQMLLQAKAYHEAEAELKRLLERRQDFYPNSGSLSETREIRFELCKALRCQKSIRKLVEAEGLYGDHANLESRDAQQAAGRDYAFRNAFELVCVRAELCKYNRAVNQLEDIWRKRDNISSKCISDINDRVVQLLDDLEMKNADAHAERVFKIVCEGNNKTPPLLSVSAIANRGVDLYDKSKRAQATKYLQMAWNTSPPSIEPNKKLKLGWYLARSRCYAGDFAKAVPLLKSIFQLPATRGSPSKDKIMTLLALSQLKTGKIKLAKENAQIIFNKYKTRKILLEALDCHQADILLQAIAQEEHYNSKYTKALEIWKEIYNNGQNLSLDIAAHKKQLKYHATAGLKLAEDCKRWRGNGGANWRNVNDIRRLAAQELVVREQAAQLRARAVA